ncbi:inositol monophosphatase [Nocardia tengchongensis]|uniref:Inositol-1-monophosphatase n=1 Tax=Nocardia tengchongensis TaxID=2055889 RepID=A0ABX8CSP3_9NOCA|nr:inositol monophosphatase family protein [Nocardia tengchongensis]QVI22922.1 inositol monophosphatase [Nocardia tengchongensis]
MNDLEGLLEVARAAAAEGSRLLSTTGPGGVRAKGDRDFVTDLDVRIQSSVREYLGRVAPEIGFLGEELEPDEQEHDAPEYRWVLDPIDGTSNFIHGIPLCAVSLALAQNDVPILGVIAAPFLSLEYYASAGHGAFCNDHRIKTSHTQSVSNAIVSIGDYAVGDNAPAKNRQRLALTTALAAEVERVRMFGSAAIDLAWVAEGRTDACILLSNKPWDMSAGVVIARESGALVTDSDGRRHDVGSAHTVAAAPGIASALLDLVGTTLASVQG